ASGSVASAKREREEEAAGPAITPSSAQTVVRRSPSDLSLTNHVDRLVPAAPAEFAGPLHSCNDLRIGRIPIDIDNPRSGMAGRTQCFLKKRLAAAASRFALRRKSIVAPVESTAR